LDKKAEESVTDVLDGTLVGDALAQTQVLVECSTVQVVFSFLKLTYTSSIASRLF